MLAEELMVHGFPVNTDPCTFTECGLGFLVLGFSLSTAVCSYLMLENAWACTF